MDDDRDSRVGSVIQGRYRVLERLASGGMGVVYRAERLQLGRTVAMKFLHSSFAGSDAFLQRFEKEAKLMSRLDHPHCVSVIDFGVADGAYIVMDFVTGTPLSDVLEDGPLEPDRVIRLARQILAGLAHAHERGIVHRDIKPDNIMLANVTGRGDHVRILDFGLAKLVDADQSVSGIAVGTPSFMSPEQACGGDVDGRADIYSTGLVLFELLAGERAFRGENAFDVIQKHKSEPPPRLADRCSQRRFSEPLERVIARCLAKDPDERFQSPVELAEALESVPEAGGEPTPEPVPSDHEPVPEATPRAKSEQEPAAAAPKPSLSRAPSPVHPLGAAPASSRPAGIRALRLALVAVVLTCLIAVLVSSRARHRIKGWAHSLAELAGSGDEAASEPTTTPETLPPTLESVDDLVEAGNTEEAIRLLHRIRRESPDNALASYRLGDLYHAKGWSPEALAAWAEAVEIDPGFKTRPDLVQRIIDALSEERTRNRASAILLRRVGKSAIPALERASRDHDDPRVRSQARQLLEQLSR